MRALLIGGLTLALVACSGPSAPPPAPRETASVPSGEVTGAAVASADPTPGSSSGAATLLLAVDDPAALALGSAAKISLATARRLVVRLRTPALPPGIHWVTLTLAFPDGTPYEVQHVPFAVGAATGKVSSRRAMTRPVDTRPALALDGGDLALDASILVGGAHLQRRPLYGRWRVTAELDDPPATRAEASIELTP